MSNLFSFLNLVLWRLKTKRKSENRDQAFVFLFVFLHLGRAIFYGSYFYNPNTWFSGIIIWFSGDIILFPDEYNSILIRTEINVPEIPKMNAVAIKKKKIRIPENQVFGL